MSSTAGESEQLDQAVAQKDAANTEQVKNVEGVPLSEVLKGIPKPELLRSPVADIGTISSQGDNPLKSVIRITTRIPVNQQDIPERIQSENYKPNQSEALASISGQPPTIAGQLPSTRSQPPLATGQTPDEYGIPSPLMAPLMAPSTPQLPSLAQPKQPYAPNELPPGSPVPTELLSTLEPSQKTQSANQSTLPVPTSADQAAPAVIGPMIKVITSPGSEVTAKVTSKHQSDEAKKRNTRFESEMNSVLNKSKSTAKLFTYCRYKDYATAN